MPVVQEYKITDIPTAATTPASDDYLELGGSTNGSRRILAEDFTSSVITALKVDSIAALRAIQPSASRPLAEVLGYHSAGDGGGGLFRYAHDSEAAENYGTVIVPSGGVGRWLRQFSGPVSVRWFGTKADGTDDTEALTRCISAANDIYIPEGTYTFSSLQLSSGKKLCGAGTSKSFLKSTVTGTSDAVTGNGAVVRDLVLQDFCILGVDGNGGRGLHLNSVTGSSFINLRISLFRNAGNTGVGLRMTNDYGVCALNAFFNLWIENCDDALTQISTNGSHSVGYNYFHGTTIYQEVNSIQLLVGAGNGGIYNSFFGITFQGNGGAGTYLKVQGSGNEILGVVLDNPGSGTRLEFTNTTTQGNYVSFVTGWDLTKFVDNSTGAANTVWTRDNVSFCPGKTFQRIQTSGTELKTQDRAPTATGSIEKSYGNDTSAQLWRWVMEGSATPYWQLAGPSNNKLYRWFTTYHKRFVSDIERERLTASGLVVEPAAVSADCVASAAMEVRSEEKGFLPPRMTTAQRDAIAAPESGLIIYNTSTGKLNVRGAAAWEAVTSV